MANAKLKVEGREIPLGHGVTTVGRSSENAVAFPHDDNISRYHAEIEFRDGDFYLIELGSSNGTQINGATVKRDERLRDGDAINFGGTSRADFSIEKEPKNIPNSNLSAAGQSESEDEPSEAANDDEKSSPWMRRATIAACALAVISLAGGYYYYSRSSGCTATATITAPENGDLVKDATEIEVKADSQQCVSRAVFTLDDMIIADADTAPYEAAIDPREFPELADGLNHSLKLTLEDAQGNVVGKPDIVLLAFETLATPTPAPEEISSGDVKSPPAPKLEKTGSLIETQEMARRLTQQFSGGFAYKFDKQFLQEVQKRSAEYATAAGYYSRAAAYRDTINVAFVQEQNLAAPLGFILAMSRSKFTPNKQNSAEGLWQMPNDFVTQNAYNGTCDVKDLSEPTQKCAAISAAAYLKNIVLNVFEGDAIYGVAAFGMSPQEAAAWKTSLPANRADFWNVIKQPKQREEVIRFFAAGIVAENPQKFGLKADQPISQLYRNLLSN